MSQRVLTAFDKYLEVLKDHGVQGVRKGLLAEWWPKVSRTGLMTGSVDKFTQFKAFIGGLGSHLVRLNHTGLRYGCREIETELAGIKKRFPILYEEKSGDPRSRWFFIGEPENWEKSLFEVVLSTYPNGRWQPHLQIDIDTSLNEGELRGLIEKTLGKDFVEWELTISDYGTVLMMGMLADYGVKIFLGVGTSLRRTEFHRKHLLKPV